MKPLKIGSKIAKIPLIQGGMGIGISMANLASAVANENAIGVISAAGVGMFNKNSTDFNKNNTIQLRKEIKKARELSEGLIGVNIMVALSNFGDLVTTSIEEGVDFIFAGAGLPLDLPSYITQGCNTKLVPIVSSARAAKLITKQWIRKHNYLPDAFVLEGPKAGGHLGFSMDQVDDKNYALETLLDQVLGALKPFEEKHNKSIPVIVGGGIYTGQDIRHYLDRGASGVQMATRFVTTTECDASLAFKQTYIDATKEDIVYIKSPVGLPGRAINNPFLKDVEKGLKHPVNCPYNCIKTCKKEQAPYCITLALLNAKKGKLQNGFAFAGANAYLADKIVTVKKLINSLIREYQLV